VGDRPGATRAQDGTGTARAGEGAAAGGTEGGEATDLEETVEALRRALQGARARIRALEDRAATRALQTTGQREVAPLPPPARARLAALQVEAAALWQELLRVGREDVPPDPESD
jgi:hypothetical protein